jgi:hypothetical protein
LGVVSKSSGKTVGSEKVKRNDNRRRGNREKEVGCLSSPLVAQQAEVL